MYTLFTSPNFFRTLSLAGTLFVVLGTLLSAVVYRGREGERYSILNHYISELGEKGVGRWAAVFNLGLILGGICLVPACISLGLILPGIWSKLGMAAGIVSAVSLALVGVYSMDRIEPHSRAAITYFRSALVMVIFFTLSISLQRDTVIIHRLFSLAGIPAITSLAVFLVYSTILYRRKTGDVPEEKQPRPRVWGITLAEWMIFLSTVPFFLMLAVGI
ncbi:MAG: DUF998 domain-containing protein [Anaerolineaceae bacterium]|jgi:hypothetical membrane protein